ncbi:MAG TPA: amidohydrolase family protein [Candidatus Eisenbacteria bacterium]|nr:amidohydrolase family protein [Candidatus Eisenbacteria bacterium]
MRLHRVQILGPQGLSEPRDVELPVDHADRDAAGLVLSPGWCDLHAHLREPGFPEKETLATGAAAAAAGGFTQVLAMANTQPVTDTADRVRANIARARDLPVRVVFVGALTGGLQGRRPTDAVALRAAGAVALSDDGRHALDLQTLIGALQQATAASLPVLIHPQDESLGSEPDAELAAVEQAVAALRQVPGARLHLQHVSLAAALPLIVEAKRAGLAVTAEATPHHLWLTADALRQWGPLAKVNPPLRTEHDVAALRGALIDGTIDIVATDHAPHQAAAKRDIETAAPGISGFETAAGMLLTLGLPWPVLYRACVALPRAILGIPLPPDWILIDPAQTWTVEPDRFLSRGRNTPMAGTRLIGRVRMTICRDRVVHQAEVPVG